MHHLTCGISFLLHSVNLILFTVLLAHLILHTSPHHSHHLRSHHLQSISPSTFHSRFLFHKSVHYIVFLVPSGLPSHLYRTKWALAFVLVSFYTFRFWLRVLARLSWHTQLFESTLNPSIVSYRIRRGLLALFKTDRFCFSDVFNSLRSSVHHPSCGRCSGDKHNAQANPQIKLTT